MEQFIKGFVEQAKQTIIELATTELNNTDKKAKLDETLKTYVNEVISKLPISFVMKVFLRKILLDNMSTLTQVVYDLLKEKIAGLTK